MALTLAAAGCAGGVHDAALAWRAKPAAGRPVELRIEVNGDLLIHAPVWRRALADGHGRYDFAPMLRAVRPYVSGADLAICHVETPMGPGPPRGYPVFRTPTALAAAIRSTGWDACDTASNHSVDGGQPGIDATRRALSAAGVPHTGSFSSPAGRRRILMLRAHGVRVALLAYTEMLNGNPLPHPWSVNLARARTVLADARRARRAGAKVVIVNLHWGIEGQVAPSAFQRGLASRLTRSSAVTAVVGQHAHVVQPIARVHGKLVVFGEGNLLSNQTAACCRAASQDGMLVFLHVIVRPGRSAVTRIRYVPTWVRHPDFTVLPVIRALRSHAAPAGELRSSYARTVRAAGRNRSVGPASALRP